MSEVAGLRWNCWPAPEDRLLLRTILHVDDDVATAAWADLRTRLDLDVPTQEQYRLYPMLADRLERIAPDEPRLGMLQGVRRQATIQTLLHLRHLDAVLALLSDKGIDAVVVKGPALALAHYEHLGQRPFDDADLLIEPSRHADAVAALEAAGWWRKAPDFEGNHAVDLRGETINVDVHRTLNRELVVPGDAAGTWGRLRFVEVARPLPSGRRISTLAPADALVHAVVHGTQWSGPVALRWVVDAVRIVGDPAVDWDRVVELAETFSVGAVLHDGLAFVRDTADADVPPRVVAELARIRSTVFERLRVRAFHRRPRVDGIARGLPMTYAVFLRRTRDRKLVGVLGAAPGYLCTVWGVERPRQLPLAIGRRVLTRMTH